MLRVCTQWCLPATRTPVSSAWSKGDPPAAPLKTSLERYQPIRGARQSRLQAARAERGTRHVPHDLRRKFRSGTVRATGEGQQMDALRIGGEAQKVRAVLNRLLYPGWERGGASLRTARASQGQRAVFRDDDPRGRHVEDLSACVRGGRVGLQQCRAARTRPRAVFDNDIGRGDPRERRACMSGLPAGLPTAFGA